MSEFIQLTAGNKPAVDQAVGGFNFDNCSRNNILRAAGSDAPIDVEALKAKKTGTTIVGCIFNGGVVLGADTRATEGPIICDKECEKIHYIAPNIYCCGAGTAADTENTTGLISSQLELHRLRTGAESRVITAMTMLKRMLFKYQGNVSAALVLGGIDITGPHLYTVYPHGSTDKLPFVTMGSGSLAAMSVFEDLYKDNMTEEEAKQMVTTAILAGIWNDLGSGGNVDVTVIKRGEDGNTVVDYQTGVEKPNDGEKLRAQVTRPAARIQPRGATAVLKSEWKKHVVIS
jgi:20S proteasome subunit beta 2